MKAEPTPIAPSCVQSIMAAIAPAASPTCAGAKRRAARAQKANPRAIEATRPVIIPIELANME